MQPKYLLFSLGLLWRSHFYSNRILIAELPVSIVGISKLGQTLFRDGGRIEDHQAQINDVENSIQCPTLNSKCTWLSVTVTRPMSPPINEIQTPSTRPEIDHIDGKDFFVVVLFFHKSKHLSERMVMADSGNPSFTISDGHFTLCNKAMSYILRYILFAR